MAVAAIVWSRLRGHKRAGPSVLTREIEVQSGMLFRAQQDPYYLRHPTGKLSEVLRLAVKADEDIHKGAATVNNAQHNHEVKVHGTSHRGMKDLVLWALLVRMVAEAVRGVRDHPDHMEAEEDPRAVALRLVAEEQAVVVDAPEEVHRVAAPDRIWDTGKQFLGSNHNAARIRAALTFTRLEPQLATSLSFFFTRTTVIFENPSSNVGGRSLPHMRCIASSSTVRLRF